MADPYWIKKTLLFSAMFGIPSLVLLVSVYRDQPIRSSSTGAGRLASWAGFVFLASYIAWFLNVTFEWSTMFMVGWPLLGILLSLIGIGAAAFVSGVRRLKLLGANGLLFILALLSVIAPN